MSKKYQPVIGLEIHVQLKTKSKMFCSTSAAKAEPNQNTCPICLAHPGTLPVINREAVYLVLKTAAALNCRIQEKTKFDRKNYFYPDLPKGYQISQYGDPLARGGMLNGTKIRRIHLEEDTGKLIHESSESKIDFNRAGIPLLELVTEPDIKSALEAKKFCQDLQMILRYLDVSRANLESGEMRCEVNISLKGKGPKVEIKNLNSFRAVEQSIEYEIKRQSQTANIIQETRGWEEDQGVSVSQRVKEDSADYRYFPDPDLPDLEISGWDLDLPELPQEKARRFLKEYKLPKTDIELLVRDKFLADYFENSFSELRQPKLKKLLVNYLLKIKDNFRKITPENMAEFIEKINSGKISSSAADLVLKEMQKTGADPDHIIAEKDLSQISSPQRLGKIISEVIKTNPQAAQDFRLGKEESLKFLIGQVMVQTKGRANPNVTERILKEIL